MLTPFVPCLLSALGRLTFSPLCQSKRKKRGDKHRALTQGRDQFLGEEWGRALSSHAQPGGTHCLVIGSESRILSDRTVARKSSAMPCTCLQCCACGSCSSAQSFRLFWWPFIIGRIRRQPVARDHQSSVRLRRAHRAGQVSRDRGDFS